MAVLSGVIRVMEKAARKAGGRLRRDFGEVEHLQVSHKGPADFVSKADRIAERTIYDELLAARPDWGFVMEEAGVIEGDENKPRWIVDPLDGTNNFARGKPPFGMIIALAANGETQAGWLWDPLNERLCHAEIGKGAFIDGTRITARPTGEDKPVAAISTVFLNEEQRHQVQRNVAPHFRLVDIPRCAAEQYPRLALGVNDVSVFNRTLAWDHAAGVLWLNEAGGRAARLDGSPYRPDQDGTGLLAAASPALWDRLADCIP